MDIDWTHELVDQLEFHWGSSCGPGWTSLTDEQYLLGAGAGMWSIRPRGGGDDADGRRRRRRA